MDFSKEKKTIFSGIQPSGEFTIGNYFGALKHWPKLQDGFNPLFCVVDEHAITVRQDPKALKERIFECAAMLLAVGIDPDKSLLFVQSHVSCHAELAWILNCSAYMGELSRMTQFKDKSQKLNSDSINMGLYDYPVLMAADILLYQADIVPVGEDQRQHLELARNIAIRFNHDYGQTFTVPAGKFGDIAAKILSLADPTKKMSKSDANKGAFVLMTDDKDTIVNKFKRAVTDSGSEIKYDMSEKPGVSNLLELYAVAADETIKSAESRFEGKGYGELKKVAGEAVAEALDPIQKRYAQILSDKAYVDSALIKGAEEARAIAGATLSMVQDKIGFYRIG